MIEISDDYIQLIELQVMYMYAKCDYHNCEFLLSLRREMINNKVLKYQEEILPDIIAFNDALQEALKEMYDRAHHIWNSIKDNKDFGDDMELTAKCFLSYEYPELHPIQGEEREEFWAALCDSSWNRPYDDGVTYELKFPRHINDSFDHFIGMDCPPPNWNEGLDKVLTKDLHLIYPFHNLFEHQSFAITDFIYVRKFETEINIKINKKTTKVLIEK